VKGEVHQHILPSAFYEVQRLRLRERNHGKFDDVKEKGYVEQVIMGKTCQRGVGVPVASLN